MSDSIQLKYALSEEDYLVYNLFSAARSRQFKRKLVAGRFIVGALYLIAGISFLMADNASIATAFFLFGLAWIFFYPVRVKYLYKRHFTKHIQENLKDALDKEGDFSIQSGESKLSVLGQEFRFSLDQITHIDRIPEYTLIKIKGGKSVIIPEKKVQESDLNKVFKIMHESTGIKPFLDLNWKW